MTRQVIAARVPESMRHFINRLVETQHYLNISDFVRDAVREKIRRDHSIVQKPFSTETKGEEGA